MTKPRPAIAHDFVLEDGFRVRMVLPHDLSKLEAERLCRIIHALAFSDEDLAAWAKIADSIHELADVVGLKP